MINHYHTSAADLDFKSFGMFLSGFLCFSVFLFLCLTVFHSISQYFPETRFFAKNSLCDIDHKM